MDITQKIRELAIKDINTFVNETVDNIYVRFNNNKEFNDFVGRINDKVMNSDKELDIYDIYLTSNNIEINKLLYPMYIKIEKYYDVLSVSIIDNNALVNKIDSYYMYDKNIYDGKDIL